VVVPWIYDEQLAHLIHRWKYRGDIKLTALLARLWLQQVQLPTTPSIDVIVPVPLHWRKMMYRGFNQSDLLCRQLHRQSMALSSVKINSKLLRRHRATTAQSGNTARQRAGNLRAAFTALLPCDNLRIAVVDDVLTTGATAAAVCGVLREAGAQHIELWCLARTPPPGS